MSTLTRPVGPDISHGMDQTVELFCGKTKTFSSIAGALGFPTFTVDLNPDCSPDLVADVRTLTPQLLPAKPLCVWAAPPDFPVFRNPGSWDTDGYAAPKSAEAEEAVEIFGTTITLIAMIKPTWWFIENPKSLLRKMPITAGFNRGYPSRIRQTIRHDQYGGAEKGETDIWTNAHWWIPRPTETAPSENSSPNRRVPPYIFAEIFGQLERYRNATESPR
jgi:hypothetical protein